MSRVLHVHSVRDGGHLGYVDGYHKLEDAAAAMVRASFTEAGMLARCERSIDLEVRVGEPDDGRVRAPGEPPASPQRALGRFRVRPRLVFDVELLPLPPVG